MHSFSDSLYSIIFYVKFVLLLYRNQELSKKEDDFDLDLDLDLEDEIANLNHDDSHEGYNEDDLLLELDEMIND